MSCFVLVSELTLLPAYFLEQAGQEAEDIEQVGNSAYSREDS